MTGVGGPLLLYMVVVSGHLFWGKLALVVLLCYGWTTLRGIGLIGQPILTPYVCLPRPLSNTFVDPS